MTSALAVIFFLSGASALVFETVWFREAGLMLGNSLWASSIVIASFMAGLAIGSLVAARVGDRAKHPIRLYAALEGTVAVSGLALVYVLRTLTPTLAPLFRLVSDSAGGLGALRLSIAFLLLLVPSTAMGATLPVLVRALCAVVPDYGRAVGRLYGMNTLGAVAGSVLGESVLIAHYGIPGAAGAAAACDGMLALGALAVASRWRVAPLPEPSLAPRSIERSGWLLLAGAFLAGGLLLVMEVVWFRFLLLFVFGTSLAFAVMLAVVLLGIGLGSLIGSFWLRFQPLAHDWLPEVAAFAGIATVLTYAAFSALTREQPGLLLFDLPAIAAGSARLMLPTSLASGVLFTLMAKRFKEEMPGEARAAAALTAANTVGAALGSLVGAFVLLPTLGMERSFLAVASGYGAMGVVLLLARNTARPLSLRAKMTLGVAAAALAGVIGLFPHGLMRNHYLRQAAGRWRDDPRILAVREGPAETLIYKRKELWGEPVFDRLVVNAFSMSSSVYVARRYMNLFVYLPVALHPGLRRALLICYGVGSTAEALTDTRELAQIDVVDTSRDILEMGRLVHRPSGGYPLDDSRVRVLVEDGRFFLQTTRRRYDLITGEPPPPKSAGVVNLYSREYFSLIHDHLEEGGMATYWLPVYQLEASETKAVIRAFCDVFEDCSAWTGMSYEWVLLGTRHARGPVSDERFSRQWQDSTTAPTLRTLGIEVPEQLGALFLADAESLRKITSGVAPLDDDHPKRISSRLALSIDPFYPRFMDTRDTKARFAASAFVAAMWPNKMRAASLAAFWPQALINSVAAHGYGGAAPGIAELAAMLTRTRLRTPIYWQLRSSAREQEIALHAVARGLRDPLLDERLGVEAMADRDYVAAEEHFRKAQPGAADSEHLYAVRVLALCLSGRSAEAGALTLEADEALRLKDSGSWKWLSGACGTPLPRRLD